MNETVWLSRILSQGYRCGPSEVLAALAGLNKTIAVATAERKARQVLVGAYKLLSD
jgi:hypothetical protein